MVQKMLRRRELGLQWVTWLGRSMSRDTYVIYLFISFQLSTSIQRSEIGGLPKLSSGMPHAEVDAEQASQLVLPHIYLELLPNIRTVSLAIQPKVSTNQQEVKVQLVDHSFISVEQQGIKTLLPLPVKVTNDPLSPLRMTNVSAKDLTSRLQPDLIALQALLDSCNDNRVPWSAQELEHYVEIRCASCANVVIKKGVIRTWQDLPSANWAEMMDFWHCHKPHEAENQNNVDKDTTKGYGAGNRLTARQGVGFVDTLSFLFSPEDCSTIKVCEHISCVRDGRVYCWTTRRRLFRRKSPL